MTDPPRYRLQAVCPECHWRPAVFAFPAQVQSAHAHPPETPMVDYKCQNADCGHIYPLAADAFQRAMPVREKRRKAA